MDLIWLFVESTPFCLALSLLYKVLKNDPLDGQINKRIKRTHQHQNTIWRSLSFQLVAEIFQRRCREAQRKETERRTSTRAHSQKANVLPMMLYDWLMVVCGWTSLSAPNCVLRIERPIQEITAFFHRFTQTTRIWEMRVWHRSPFRISETKRKERRRKAENTCMQRHSVWPIRLLPHSIAQTDAFLFSHFFILFCIGWCLVAYVWLLRRRRFSVCCTLLYAILIEFSCLYFCSTAKMRSNAIHARSYWLKYDLIEKI